MAGTNLSAEVNSNLFILLTDKSGYAVMAQCNGTPPTTAGVFQRGCSMVQLDAAPGNALTHNAGTVAIPSWA